jgi:hypothetical protein
LTRATTRHSSVSLGHQYQWNGIVSTLKSVCYGQDLAVPSGVVGMGSAIEGGGMGGVVRWWGVEASHWKGIRCGSVAVEVDMEVEGPAVLVLGSAPSTQLPQLFPFPPWIALCS